MFSLIDLDVNLVDVVEFARFVWHVRQVLLGNCSLVCLAKQVKHSSPTRVTSFESLKHYSVSDGQGSNKNLQDFNDLCVYQNFVVVVVLRGERIIRYSNNIRILFE